MRGWILGFTLGGLGGCDVVPGPEAETDGPPETEVVDTPYGPAEVIDAETLAALSETHDIFEPAPDEHAQAAADLESAVAAAEARIADYLQAHPELKDQLLVEVGAPYTASLELDGAPVALHGDTWNRLSVARSIAVLSDASHQARILEDLVGLVPEHCSDGLPAIEDWPTLDADELVASRSRLVACWRVWREVQPIPESPGPLDGTEPGFENSWTSRTCDLSRPDTDGPGLGNDGWAEVRPMLHGMAQWRYREALPPIRDQGRRGTCAAFAAISAMEWTLRRRLDSYVDISEQGLYALAKRELFNSPYGDGLPTNHLLHRLADEGWTFPVEDTWGYNPSVCRERNDGLQQYRQSCLRYGNTNCGESTHQMRPLVSGGSTFLLRPRDPATDLDLTDALDILVHHQASDSIDAMRIYLEGGFGVVAGVTWPENSWGMGWGVGEASALFDVPDGGHAIHVVRVIDDESAPGGGWLVFKNSWGAGWGDNGYGYLPLRDFRSALHSLTAVDAAAVQNEPPTIEVLQDGELFPLTPSGITLEAVVDDAEEGPGCCEVVWSENGQELGRGDTLLYVPTVPGTHRLTVAIRDRYGATAETTAVVRSYQNDSPLVDIVRPVRNGGSYTLVPSGGFVAFSAEVSDDTAVDCASYRWTLDGGTPREDCTAQWWFPQSGTFDVMLEVTDREGEVARDTLRLVVEPHDPALGPYVQIIEPRDGALYTWSEDISTYASRHPAFGDTSWVLVLQDGTEVDLGEQGLFDWRPEDIPGLAPGANSVQLRVTHAAGGDLAEDTIALLLQMPFE